MSGALVRRLGTMWDVRAGADVWSAVRDLVAMANRDGETCFMLFNGRLFDASPGDSTDDVHQRQRERYARIIEAI